MKLLDELRREAALAGCDWAELNKQYKDLKELLPSIRAMLESKYGQNRPTTAKTMALADLTYQEKVKEMNEAEYQMRMKEVEYRGLMKSIEALTSISYVRNNELKLAR